MTPCSSWFPGVSLQAVPPGLRVQTLPGSDPAQDDHQARLPPHRQVPHRPRCVCDASREREREMTWGFSRRTLPERSAQEEAGHVTVPHVLEVRRGESGGKTSALLLESYVFTHTYINIYTSDIDPGLSGESSISFFCTN